MRNTLQIEHRRLSTLTGIDQNLRIHNRTHRRKIEAFILDTPQRLEDLTDSAIRSFGVYRFLKILRSLTGRPGGGVLLMAPMLHKHDLVTLWSRSGHGGSATGGDHA